MLLVNFNYEFELGMRENAKSIDFSSFLSSALEEQVKTAAEISMGTEIAEDDIQHIVQMCDEVICHISWWFYLIYAYVSDTIVFTNFITFLLSKLLLIIIVYFYLHNNIIYCSKEFVEILLINFLNILHWSSF